MGRQGESKNTNTDVGPEESCNPTKAHQLVYKRQHMPCKKTGEFARDGAEVKNSRKIGNDGSKIDDGERIVHTLDVMHNFASTCLSSQNKH